AWPAPRPHHRSARCRTDASARSPLAPGPGTPGGGGSRRSMGCAQGWRVRRPYQRAVMVLRDARGERRADARSLRAPLAASRALTTLAAGLEQEPGAPLRLVDPDFQQARGSDVLLLVAKPVRLAQGGDQLLVVVAQLRQHV